MTTEQSAEGTGSDQASTAAAAPATAPVGQPPTGDTKTEGDGSATGAGQNDQEPKTITVGDDEYIVDPRGMVQIPMAAFKKRLNRYNKTQLKEAFGTDDVEDLKSRLAEHGELKAQSEKQRIATLKKEEQLAEELAKERKLREEMEHRANQLAEDREYREADQEIRQLAESYVKPGKFVKLAMVEFAEYVRELDDDEAEKLKPRDVRAWFEKYAKENPDLAKPDKAGEKKPEVKKPISHGAGDQGSPPAAPAGVGGKTPRPGAANSMTDAEYRAYKASLGLRS